MFDGFIWQYRRHDRDMRKYHYNLYQLLNYSESK